MPSIETNRQAGKAAVESGALVRATPTPSVAPPTPPLTNTNQSNTFLRTPLPASYVQQPDQQRSWQAWGVTPQSRVPPLPPASNAQSGASAASQATVVVEQTPPSTGTGGGITSVGLTVPSFLTVTGSPVVPPSGTFNVGLATENPGTYFSVPSSTLPSLENSVTGSLTEGPSGSGTLSLTLTPTSTTSWGIYAASYNGTLTTPPGFTAFGGGIAENSGFFNSFSGLSPITVTQAVAANSTAAGVLAIFAGAIPSIVQQAAATFTGTTPLTKAFTSNNTAGNTIVVVVSTVNNSFGPFSLSVSDSAGNLYTTIGYVQSSGSSAGFQQPSVLVAIATNIAGSANTVSANITGRQAGGNSGVLQIIEYPALTAAASIPVFKQILPGDVPPINLASAGNGGISGILRPVNGGTGSDLSTTGGTSLFLSQLSTGAIISPTQPDFSDLAGATGKLATKYNGITLVSNGIPSEIKTVDLTGQTAAIGTTNLLASVPTTGQYRLCWNSKVTTPDGASSTLGPLTIVYTDADNTVQTITAGAQNKNGTIETSDTGNSTTTVMLGLPMMLNARASTAITYAMAYASGTPATMAFNLHLKLEVL